MKLKKHNDKLSESLSFQPSFIQSAASSVSELQETIRRLEDKMKTLVEEVGNKDAMLAESERLRYYLEKDMNNMCIKMR